MVRPSFHSNDGVPGAAATQGPESFASVWPFHLTSCGYTGTLGAYSKGTRGQVKEEDATGVYRVRTDVLVHWY
jgi:hypothetical protein